MIKKIVSIATVILAVGLILFIWKIEGQEKKETQMHTEWYEARRPLTVKKEQLEQQLEDLDEAYETAKNPRATTQVIFTELSASVYDVCYPIMKEFEYTGILALSKDQLPGKEGCMTIEQFRELLDEGWTTCIEWSSDTAVNKWWPELQEELQKLTIPQSTTMYFPIGTYKGDYDKELQEMGFATVVVGKTGDENPLQLQYEEGVWHIGAVGLMSSKPRLWLNESVAQKANVIYTIGFREEESENLFNEKSFRSMLNCFDEYEATDAISVTNVEEAREYFQNRLMGVSPEIEAAYQENRAAIEAQLKEVNKQLDELAAKYQ